MVEKQRIGILLAGALALAAGCTRGLPATSGAAPAPVAASFRHVQGVEGLPDVRPNLPTSLAPDEAARVLVTLDDIQLVTPSGSYGLQAVHGHGRTPTPRPSWHSGSHSNGHAGGGGGSDRHAGSRPNWHPSGGANRHADEGANRHAGGGSNWRPSGGSNWHPSGGSNWHPSEGSNWHPDRGATWHDGSNANWSQETRDRDRGTHDRGFNDRVEHQHYFDYGTGYDNILLGGYPPGYDYGYNTLYYPYGNYYYPYSYVNGQYYPYTYTTGYADTYATSYNPFLYNTEGNSYAPYYYANVSTMQAPVGNATINIQNYAFQPATVVLASGGTVRWTNMDGVPHSATPDAPDVNGLAFWTGDLVPGQTSQPITFTEPGVFSYHCRFHQNMTGQVIVR